MVKQKFMTPNYFRARHPGGVPKGSAAHGKAGGTIWNKISFESIIKFEGQEF
jgi:hypothetical protein